MAAAAAYWQAWKSLCMEVEAPLPEYVMDDVMSVAVWAQGSVGPPASPVQRAVRVVLHLLLAGWLVRLQCPLHGSSPVIISHQSVVPAVPAAPAPARLAA